MAFIPQLARARHRSFFRTEQGNTYLDMATSCKWLKLLLHNQPKFTAVFNTQLSLILHLSALPAWQYALNTTQPSMDQHTVYSLHCRARTPAHSFLKLTTKYLLKHKMTQCSTYTTPNLPPTLAACLAVCKGIHSNKCRPIKSS